MKSRTQLVSWSINYYKEQGGQGEPSEESSGITASKVQIRNEEGDLLQEIDREFAEFKCIPSESKTGMDKDVSFAIQTLGIFVIVGLITATIINEKNPRFFSNLRTNHLTNSSKSQDKELQKDTNEKIVQKRFSVVESVSCRGGEYHSGCLEVADNYPDNRTESQVTFSSCMERPDTIDTQILDGYLSRGARIVQRQSPQKISTRVRLGTQFVWIEQTNTCNISEVIFEGPQKLFEPID